MAWQGVLGHDDVARWFRRAAARGRLASTFLFVGPAGIGKHTFALRLAQALLCQHPRAEESLDPCQECESCRLARAGNHPDLHQVSRPQQKSSIPIELLIGERERRMQSGLCHEIALKPYLSDRKVAIIDDADWLNVEGANSLLKTLEEPPPGSVLILISSSAEKQLPTIRSRCQVVRFRPLETAVIAQLLLEREIVCDTSEAQRLAAYSEGSFERATQLADAELWDFRQRMLPWLIAPLAKGNELSSAMSAFLDAAGREAPVRRQRARDVLGLAIDFYRQLLRRLSGEAPGDENEASRLVQSAADEGRLDAERAAALLERTLLAVQHVDSNANQPNWLDGWIDDLGQIEAHGAVSLA